MEEFDFNSFKASSLEQIKNEASLFGKEGVFTPLLENIFEDAIDREGRKDLLGYGPLNDKQSSSFSAFL